MKNLKYIVLSFLAIFYLEIKACSWFSADAEYYNLFDQQLLADKSLLPFLSTLDQNFYTQDYWAPEQRNTDSIDYNILDWKQFFDNQIPINDLKYIVYKSTIAELQSIVATKNIKAGEEIFVSYGSDYWKAMKVHQ